MGEPEDSEDRELRARLDRLSKALEDRRTQEEGQQVQGEAAAAGRGMTLGFRVLADLLAGILVGAGIGWLLDRWLSTKPYLMIVFLFLGTAAGILNVMRAASGGPPRRPGNGGS